MIEGPRLFWPLKMARATARAIFGQKRLGPLKGKSRFCARDHLESLNWPHLVIWQGWLDNTKPHLQHSCIGIFMQPVLNSFLRPFFGFWSFVSILSIGWPRFIFLLAWCWSCVKQRLTRCERHVVVMLNKDVKVISCFPSVDLRMSTSWPAVSSFVDQNM